MLKYVGVVLRPVPPPEADRLADAFIKELEKEGVKVWRGIVPDTGEFAKVVPELDLVFVFGARFCTLPRLPPCTANLSQA